MLVEFCVTLLGGVAQPLCWVIRVGKCSMPVEDRAILATYFTHHATEVHARTLKILAYSSVSV